MKYQELATGPGPSGPSPYRTTARIVGMLFIAGLVLGIGSNILVLSLLRGPDALATLSANSVLLSLGALGWLLAGTIVDAAHGVLMYPILKQQHERVAIGYLAARIVDGTFIAIMVLCILLQLPLAREYLNAAASDAASLQALSTLFVQVNLYAYHIAMLTLGIAGLLLCSAFFRAPLVPRMVAVWGLVGYATILGGSVFELLGVNLQSIHTLPGGLWELFIGVWLIVKGFSPAVVPNEQITPSTPPIRTVPQVGSAPA